MRICLTVLLFVAVAIAGQSASAQVCREACDARENACLATCDARLDPVICIDQCSADADRCLARCGPRTEPGPPKKSDSPPIFCCTRIGKIGPYTNPSVPFGGVCVATTPDGFTSKGKACY